MAKWSSENILLTQKGRELLSKVQSGVGKLTITRVLTGAGRVDPSALYNQTGVSDPKQDLTLVKVKTTEQGSNLDLKVNNFNLDTSYSVNQIGVYANHPDMGEILYMIAQCDEGTSDTMPLPSVTPVTLNYKFFLIHGSSAELEITIEPAGYITPEDLEEIRSEVDYVEDVLNNHIEDFEKHKVKFTELCDFVGYNDNEVYGVEVDFENNICTRIGASVGLSPSDFDNIAPWGGRRRCNVTFDGKVVAYYGDPAYSDKGFLLQDVMTSTEIVEAGTPVQTMVEQPKFWYKVVPLKLEKQEGQAGYSLCKVRYYISSTPREGFKLFPLFARGNPIKEVNVAYLSAYMGSLADNVFDAPYFIFNFSGDALADGTITIKCGGEKLVEVPISKGESSSDVIPQRLLSQNVDNWVLSQSGNEQISFVGKNGFRCGELTVEQTSGVNLSLYFSNIDYGSGYLYNNEEVILAESDCTQYKMCSIAKVKAVTQHGNQLLSPSLLRCLCSANNSDSVKKGFGWGSYDVSAHCCTVWLHLIEYASFDCQSTVGWGTTTYYGNITNGLTSSLGNSSGHFSDTPTYRGEENLWAGLGYLIDGVSIENYPINDPNDGGFYVRPHISTSGIYADTPAEGASYNYAGFSLIRYDGFTSRIGYDSIFDWLFLPTQSEGSSNFLIPDYCNSCYDRDEVWFHLCNYVALDSWYSGLNAYDFAGQISNLSGRLLFIPEPNILI